MVKDPHAPIAAWDGADWRSASLHWEKDKETEGWPGTP